MKKLLPLLIGFLLVQHSLAQEYHPFPESNAMWRLQWGMSGCAFSNLYADYQYLIAGDTVISDLQYHKLQRSGSFNCAPPLQPWSGYMGAYRNDADDRRVWFVPADSTNEVLLYDFNLQVGDTITGYLQMVSLFEESISTITSIDSIEIGMGYRKRWNYTSTYTVHPGSIIEGIGGEYGPLESLMAMMDFNGSLLCHKHNDEVLYQLQFASCDLATEITTNEIHSFSIFPNPVIDHLVVMHMSDASVAEIHEIHGRLVRTATLQRDGSLSVAGLPAGIYMLTLRSPEINGHARFLKLDGW
jgi:hypothetical protein